MHTCNADYADRAQAHSCSCTYRYTMPSHILSSLAMPRWRSTARTATARPEPQPVASCAPPRRREPPARAGAVVTAAVDACAARRGRCRGLARATAEVRVPALSSRALRDTRPRALRTSAAAASLRPRGPHYGSRRARSSSQRQRTARREHLCAAAADASHPPMPGSMTGRLISNDSAHLPSQDRLNVLRTCSARIGTESSGKW